MQFARASGGLAVGRPRSSRREAGRRGRLTLKVRARPARADTRVCAGMRGYGAARPGPPDAAAGSAGFPLGCAFPAREHRTRPRNPFLFEAPQVPSHPRVPPGATPTAALHHPAMPNAPTPGDKAPATILPETALPPGDQQRAPHPGTGSPRGPGGSTTRSRRVRSNHDHR